MPRKKRKSDEVTSQEPVSASVAVAEPQPDIATCPAYIDGPPVDADGTIARPEEISRPYIDGTPVNEEDRIRARPDAKNWGDPYKAIVTTKDFEMGENRRFKQRVFKFREKPADDVIAELKDNGFTYRPAEKAWTISASAETRLLSDRLAKEFSGPAQGAVR